MDTCIAGDLVRGVEECFFDAEDELYFFAVLTLISFFVELLSNLRFFLIEGFSFFVPSLFNFNL